jgi:pyrophosphate--fructose-6-phosphate 1-phosphotransferase
MLNISPLENHRKQYKPKLPQSLTKGLRYTSIQTGEATESLKDQEQIKQAFPKTYGMPILRIEDSSTEQPVSKPLKVGVILSGGQAPGGHNVIAGLFDGIRDLHSESVLYGFLGGPGGLEKGLYEIIDAKKMDSFRNTGGFDIIGSGRTKLETTDQFDRCITVTRKLGLDAVVIIGGDDSNTNAAVLAEYYQSKGETTSVIGVPKTIDGDLKNEHVPTSFGFDTAVKTYAELVGNIAKDARSARKYWHFIKLMGRSASHIALEVGLQTQPNVVLVSEEVEKDNMSLDDVVNIICHSITNRANQGKNYGVVLVPEGLIEFIPSIKKLIANLNDQLAAHASELEQYRSGAEKAKAILPYLKESTKSVFLSLPEKIQFQLVLDRDPHGNVQVSRIETESLLIEMVETRLQELKKEDAYQGAFVGQPHFFGYEGRCAPPSNFDADYTYSVGYGGTALIQAGATGYMSCVQNLTENAKDWIAGGIPITMLLNMEQRHGKQKPVIQKALVDLEGAPFAFLAKNRDAWALEDAYLYPGPIQYFGPSDICDQTNHTLALETVSCKI